MSNRRLTKIRFFPCTMLVLSKVGSLSLNCLRDRQRERQSSLWVAGFYSQDISVKVLNREVFDKQAASVFQACVSWWVPLVPLRPGMPMFAKHEPFEIVEKTGLPCNSHGVTGRRRIPVFWCSELRTPPEAFPRS
jgi:hypothetical protein